MVEKLAWVKEGLFFSCTGCGKCCTGFPGYVWLEADEIERLASYLQMDKESFLKKYTRTVGDRISLKEHPSTFACPLLKDKVCTVHEAKPKQCRTFPFWKENVASEKAWLETASFCEGINHKEAAFVPFSEIQKNVKEKG